MTTAAHVNEAKPRINRAMRYLAVLRALPDRRERGRLVWMLHKHAQSQLAHIDPALRGHILSTDIPTDSIARALVVRGFAEQGPSPWPRGFRITPEGRWLRELLGEAIEGVR